MALNYNCKLLNGYKPCKKQTMCFNHQECESYAPQGERILIVKLGALGDVIRTTPLLQGLKKRHPVSHITWVTDEAAVPLLQNNPLIDVLLPFGFEAYIICKSQLYASVICLDKDLKAVAFADQINATRRYGFKMSPYGNISCHNGAEYALRLGLQDSLKFEDNGKSYQEIVFGLCGLSFEDEPCQICFTASELCNNEKGAIKYIGLNTGCGPRWKQREWGVPNWVNLCHALHRDKPDYRIMLLGGKAELELNRAISWQVDITAKFVEPTGLRNFALAIAKCDVLVTSDSLAMHIANAVGVPPVVLLGPTHTPEIYLYGKGRKVVSGFPCVPCFNNECYRKPGCVESIPVSAVSSAVAEVLSDAS